jgi:hypothetical protein
MKLWYVGPLRPGAVVVAGGREHVAVFGGDPIQVPEDVVLSPDDWTTSPPPDAPPPRASTPRRTRPPREKPAVAERPAADLETNEKEPTDGES